MQPESIATSARKFAHMALRRHGEAPDDTIVVMHAALAVEHLAKSYLCGLHPSLIVDGKHFDSLLHAAGQASHARVGISGIRTISCREATTRLRRFLAGMPSEIDVTRLVEARDGLVHVGGLGDIDVAGLLHISVRICDAVVAKTGPRDAFWGEFLGTIDLMLGEHESAVLSAVSLRMAGARQYLEATYGALDNLQREPILAAFASARRRPDPDESSEHECPVCGYMGFIEGWSELRWEPDFDVEDGREAFQGMYGQLVLVSETFRCVVCNLEFDDVDELEASGLPSEVELRDANDDEYREYYSEG